MVVIHAWSPGAWRPVYRIFFLSAATYAVASNLINVAIDLGEYYTGSLMMCR